MKASGSDDAAVDMPFLKSMEERHPEQFPLVDWNEVQGIPPTAQAAQEQIRRKLQQYKGQESVSETPEKRTASPSPVRKLDDGPRGAAVEPDIEGDVLGGRAKGCSDELHASGLAARLVQAVPGATAAAAQAALKASRGLYHPARRSLMLNGSEAKRPERAAAEQINAQLRALQENEQHGAEEALPGLMVDTGQKNSLQYVPSGLQGP